jgi:tRNA(Ile)-lysidine synthase
MTVTLPQGLEARLGYDKFLVCDEAYAEPLPDLPLLRNVEVSLHIPGQTPLPGSDWYVTAQIIARGALDDRALRHANPWQAYLDCDVTGSKLHLRPRRTGDRFCPQGLGQKPTTVNSFMINAKIPHAWRDMIPLLVRSAEPFDFAQDALGKESLSQVLWVAGWRIDERAKVTEATRHILSLTFEKDSRSGA